MNKITSQQKEISKNILAVGLGATLGAWIGYTILNSNSLENAQIDSTDNLSNTKQSKKIPSNPILPFSPVDVQRVKEYMLNKPERYQNQNIRDYTMLCFNINVGLRAPDLINLRIGDIWKDGKVVDILHIDERSKKSVNKPTRNIPLRDELKLLLNNYLSTIQDWDENHYLFQARGTPCKPMNVKSINAKMRGMKKVLGIEGNIGTLSMTKTFAKEKVSQLLGNEDFADIEKIKHIYVGYYDVPELYEHGEII